MVTDGFVEQRGASIDDGVLAVGETVRDTLHRGSPDRPGAVVDRLHRRNPNDDACALAAESVGERAQPPRVGAPSHPRT